MPVRRAVGAVDATGKLLNAGSLISNGFLSKTAKIKIMAFDVDHDEVDRVYFNDHYLGTLKGSNGAWSENTFTFPIEKVNFGRNALDVNIEGMNNVRIEIDQTGTASRKSCTSVDWVDLDFDAIAPIFLVHGTNAGPKTWERPASEITDYLESVGIPFSNDISVIELEPNGSIRKNGEMLARRVAHLAYAFGAKKCHIVAHSKGGNDSREFLLRHYDPKKVEVLSLYTLSPPFHGTVVADIIFESRSTPGIDESSNKYIQTLLTGDLLLPDFLLPHGDALRDNKTSEMIKYNSRSPFPGGFRFYNFAADADLNDNRRISSDEASVFPSYLPFRTAVAEANYLALATVKSVRSSTVTRVVPIRGGVTKIEVPVIEIKEAAPDFRENDLVVTVESSQHPSALYLGQLNANHSTMKSADTMRGILSRVNADFPRSEP